MELVSVLFCSVSFCSPFEGVRWSVVRGVVVGWKGGVGWLVGCCVVPGTRTYGSLPLG